MIYMRAARYIYASRTGAIWRSDGPVYMTGFAGIYLFFYDALSYLYNTDNLDLVQK